MKRIPVTQASYKKLPPNTQGKGKNNIGVTSGPIDKRKLKEAAAMGTYGINFGRPTMMGAASSFYNNSYMNSNGGTSGMGDIPQYFAFLNEQNGGVLYYPVTLKERYEWYRYFSRSDAYVRAAINLHTDLPMSRLVLRMPKMKDKNLRKKILTKYENMVKNLNLFNKLHSILYETNVIGNAFAFVQFSEEKKEWEKIVILPPEEINVASYPMSNISRIQYRPEITNSLLRKYTFPLDSYENYCKYIDTLPEEEKEALQGVDFELIKQLKENNGTLIMDTNPYSGDENSKIGSFVFHFCEKRHEYQELGVSPLECILTPLLMKEHYKHTQLSLAARNMTPRNVVTGTGITPAELEDLRDQVDQSMLSPDYSIVANYDVNWQVLGAENRLIDLQREYETIENQLFAGLGVTRELLTGEGLYSGNKISIEILNTKYLLKREFLQNFVEDKLFEPVALENGFFEDDEDGNRRWFYPKLSFSRLTIRDNSEVFDNLFQLYQKGSIPVGTILDLFNLDEDEIDEKLKRDMFTPKDAVYNDMLRGIYSEMGSKISENTDLANQIAETMVGPLGKRLKYKEMVQEEEGEYDQGFGEEEQVEETEESDNTVEVEDIVETDKREDSESSDQNEMINEYLNQFIEKSENNEEKDNSEKNETKEASFKMAKKN